MAYTGPSLSRFEQHQGVSNNYSNKQDINFKLFPFTTHKAKPSVAPGPFLRQASAKTVNAEKGSDSLAKQIYELIEADVPASCQDLVRAAFSDIAAVASSCDANNLRIALAADSDTSAEKIAWYLVSMSGNEGLLKEITCEAIAEVNTNANLVERLIYRVVPIEDGERSKAKPYYRVNRALSDLFLQDLRLIFSNTKLTDQYLSSLLEYYFFMFVVQNCLTVGKKMKGERDSIHPLYFALDWEKTTQGRQCYKQGFKTLEPAIEDMFVHAGVLEILNTNDDSEQYDYIAIREALSENPSSEGILASKVRSITEKCKELINNPELFMAVEPQREVPSVFEEEVEYLYRTVRTILLNTDRDKPRSEYSNSFRLFCQSGLCFEKVRGRSGTMLNLTEDALMLLTAISIGTNETLSLTEMFKKFEARGVFLDEPSREEVAKFFERRSMLDKKSDSGETQYVKRIL